MIQTAGQAVRGCVSAHGSPSPVRPRATRVQMVAGTSFQPDDLHLLARRFANLAGQLVELTSETRVRLDAMPRLRGKAAETFDGRVAEWVEAQQRAITAVEDISQLLRGFADAMQSADLDLLFRAPLSDQATLERDLRAVSGSSRSTTSSRIGSREIRWSLYVASSDLAQAESLVASLWATWEAWGLERVSRSTDAVYSSFFQEWWTLFRSRKAARRVVNAVVAAAVELPQATADKTEAEAVATLMAQAKDPSLGNVVLRARDVVLVKFVPVTGGLANIVAVQLTPVQRQRLDENPHWLWEPSLLLPRLNGEAPPALPR